MSTRPHREPSMISQSESGYGSDYEDMDFLMPNGMVVPLKCERRKSIGNIKDELWSKATELPGANLLRDPKFYVFIGVKSDSVEQEFDDSTTFRDLDLVWPMLEVSVPKRDRDTNRLYRIVGDICGVTIQSLDTASEKDQELYVHRLLLKKLGSEEAKKRKEWSMDRQTMFFYPAILDINQDLPYSTAKLIMKAHNKICITAWLFEDNKEYSFEVTVAATDPPSTIVAKILQKKYEERYQSDSEIYRRVQDTLNLYILKVCGKEEYMLKECCAHAYKYIRNCINNVKKPQLQIVLKDHLYKCVPQNLCVMLEQDEETPEKFEPPRDATSTWDLPHTDNYSIRINSLPARKYENLRLEYYVQATIMHGNTALSKAMRTLDKGFNQLIEFDVSIQSMPRCARLCFIVCSLEKSKGFSDARILGRLNVNVFDSNGVLITGNFSKGIWEAMETSNKYTPGLVDGNPDPQALQLTYDIFSPVRGVVLYPPEEEIDKIIEQENKADTPRRESSYKRSDKFKRLDLIAEQHPLEKLATSEKEFLWHLRNFLPDYNPNLLPWLYHSVDWLTRNHVFEFYRLLKLWPTKRVLLPTALRLLGPDFLDSRTRQFAVRCIVHHSTPEQLRLYLPQLIQAYRFDNYLKNELGYFLIYEAWKDKTLGHDFFWHLRCEMSRTQSKYRFAPLLEAFCLYCGDAILKERESEVKAMRKYQEVSREIKREQNAANHPTILNKWLLDEETRAILQDKASIMEETVELGELCVDECRLLTSKMRPLWLTWKNRSRVPEEMGNSTVKYIVKCGDDLRQDMLVGQLLNLMDMLWKFNETDYQLTVYNCLALEDDIGVIEVVRDALTVCDIAIKSEKGLFSQIVSSTHIHEWLTNQVYTENRCYLDMVRRFTHSCAGYCVATYLLGVGDRHSDNIMITTEGKLFHIDFGHFMNHKKTKGGVKRERNPFVLTNDFLRVINRGSSSQDKEDKRFQEFVYMCFEAFMIIRRNANLFITLLQTMMHCGIPELTENKDIQYFIDALCLGKPEFKAAEHFVTQLLKSVKGQWTVKIDWMFHRFNRLLKSSSNSY